MLQHSDVEYELTLELLGSRSNESLSYDLITST